MGSQGGDGDSHEGPDPSDQQGFDPMRRGGEELRCRDGAAACPSAGDQDRDGELRFQSTSGMDRD